MELAVTEYADNENFTRPRGCGPKAADVKCLLCGGGLADVAPELDLREMAGGSSTVWMFCHCVAGHELTLQVNPDGWVEVMSKARGARIQDAIAKGTGL